MQVIERLIISVSEVMGKIVMTIFESAKKALHVVMKTIIPFLIFITTFFTLITSTGFGNFVAQGLTGLSSSILGLVALALITTFPLISPILGPGAVIQSLLGGLIGGLIAKGDIPLAMALPAVFAINEVGGSDFVPVGMSLSEAEPETIEVGVPAVLYGKFLWAPVNVIIAYLVGIALFR